MSMTKHLTCWIWILKRRQWFPILEDWKKIPMAWNFQNRWQSEVQQGISKKGMFAARVDSQTGTKEASDRIPKRWSCFHDWLRSMDLSNQFKSSNPCYLLVTFDTVDGRNPASVEVGRLSHYLQCFSTIPGGWLGFLPSTVSLLLQTKSQLIPLHISIKECSQKHLLSSFPRPTPRLEMHPVKSLHPSRPHQGNAISDLHALHWSGEICFGRFFDTTDVLGVYILIGRGGVSCCLVLQRFGDDCCNAKAIE